jgi:hypothetical protein
MSILESIGAVNAIFKGATGLVRELRRPNPEAELFASVLREQMAEARAPERQQAQILKASEAFVRLRDANADGVLNRDESGLSSSEFGKLDLDGDGVLSTEELRRSHLESLSAKMKE